MPIELEYSANLTGASFLFFEFKQVIKLYQQGLSEKEIREKVIKENLFQYKHTSSLKRSLPSLIRRANVLDETLRQMLLEGQLETGKVITLYAIMKTDRLFFEFMNEIIAEKFAENNYVLEKKDLNIFFTYKAEQNEKIAGWTDKTVKKLKQVYNKILFESGILRDKKSGKLNKLLLDEDLKRHLIYLGDRVFVRAIGSE
jgi:hypothetical protein